MLKLKSIAVIILLLWVNSAISQSTYYNFTWKLNDPGNNHSTYYLYIHQDFKGMDQYIIFSDDFEISCKNTVSLISLGKVEIAPMDDLLILTDKMTRRITVLCGPNTNLKVIFGSNCLVNKTFKISSAFCDCDSILEYFSSNLDSSKKKINYNCYENLKRPNKREQDKGKSCCRMLTTTVFNESGNYDTKFFGDGYRFELVIDINHIYYLFLYDDNLGVNVISFGSWQSKSGTIYFTDSFNTLKFSLTQRSISKYTLTGNLKILQNATFYKESICGRFSDFINWYEWIIKPPKDTTKSIESAPHYLSLNMWYVDSSGCRLLICKKGGYKFYFRDILLSKGKWIQNGNELSLTDKKTKANFKMKIIADNRMVNINLPGFQGDAHDFGNYYLKKRRFQSGSTQIKRIPFKEINVDF